jgi:hypothetical protein
MPETSTFPADSSSLTNSKESFVLMTLAGAGAGGGSWGGGGGASSLLDVFLFVDLCDLGVSCAIQCDALPTP